MSFSDTYKVVVCFKIVISNYLDT